MMTDLNDQTQCPLCDEINLCAMTQGKSLASCWCTKVGFSPQVLDAVPQQSKGKSCICQRCVARLALVTQVQ